MDLKISGRKALVCGASKGLGFGCAKALLAAGVEVTICARGADGLKAAKEALENEATAEVAAVSADVTTKEGRALITQAAPDIDILVTNAGGPPPGHWSDWSHDDFLNAIEANMMTPIALMQHYLPKMKQNGWGRVINITSQSVKSPIPILGLSNAARAGLTGFVAGTARDVAPFGVNINNLLPGIHATDRATALDQGVASAQNISLEEAMEKRQQTIPARRYGSIEEFGAICAFLASEHAGFIVGQNILADGGAVNATF